MAVEAGLCLPLVSSLPPPVDLVRGTNIKYPFGGKLPSGDVRDWLKGACIAYVARPEISRFQLLRLKTRDLL